MIKEFKRALERREKSHATIEKYVRDVKAFLEHTKGRTDRDAVMGYKEFLKKRCKTKSVNSMLCAVNCYLEFIGRPECKVRLLKVQRKNFEEKSLHLTKAEYGRLLAAAKGNERLYLLLQTICSTGVRVSEVKFITAEALERGRADIDMKGKKRTIILPGGLCRALLKYAKRRRIKSGEIFITRSGNPMNRTNIWREMKALSRAARVDERKVFPHNLRHLFAVTFYRAEKDIVRLADILGHSSIETTRIYTLETSEEQRRKIERLGLLPDLKE